LDITTTSLVESVEKTELHRMEVDRLIEELHHDELSIRINAARSLRWVGSDLVIPPLVGALRDAEEGVRFQALRALREITGKDLGETYEDWAPLASDSAPPPP